MTTWQRLQFLQLGRAADVLFFSISAWTEKHRSWFPGKQIHHLPVGSNIPRIPITREEARARLGLAPDVVVIGVFGQAHVSRSFEQVRTAAQAVRQSGRDVRVLYIGPDASEIRKTLESIPLIAEGALPADEVSRRLSAVDVFVATYTDGISTRRGAMIAALQHGLAVVGTRGFLTDPELLADDGRAFLLAPSGDSAAFNAAVRRVAGDDALRRNLGEEGERVYKERYAWPRIAGRLVEALRSTDAPPASFCAARAS